MARIDVLMPQMGESIAEGTLSKWLKKLGDEVKRDEPLFEISTDKVDAEIPAPTAGVLAEIKVQEGQTVPVQTLVAVIETDKAAPAAAPVAPPVAAAQRAPAAPGGTAVSPQQPTAPSRPLPPSTAPVKGGDGAETAEERLRRKSTPLVRKIAAEHRVDISTIPGTGFAGRVTKQDILGVIERGGSLVSPVPSPQPLAPAVAAPAVEPWPGDRVEPFSKIRKITADHMIMSRRVSAHVTSFFEVDYSRVAELRRKHKATGAERGANLTYLAFIAKACAENLRKHRIVNAAVSVSAHAPRSCRPTRSSAAPSPLPIPASSDRTPGRPSSISPRSPSSGWGRSRNVPRSSCCARPPTRSGFARFAWSAGPMSTASWTAPTRIGSSPK